jgi:acyl carrier protein
MEQDAVQQDAVHQDGVLAGLTDVLAEVARVDRSTVTAEARLAEDLGIDSMTLVDVVVAAEDRFGLVIPDDDWARFETVGDAVAHLERSMRLPR